MCVTPTQVMCQFVNCALKKFFFFESICLVGYFGNFQKAENEEGHHYERVIESKLEHIKHFKNIFYFLGYLHHSFVLLS